MVDAEPLAFGFCCADPEREAARVAASEPERVEADPSEPTRSKPERSKPERLVDADDVGDTNSGIKTSEGSATDVSVIVTPRATSGLR